MRNLPKLLNPSRALAIAEGGLVCIIWASSFVFVKMGLSYAGPITLAGTRYFLAFLLLLPFLVSNRKAQKNLAPNRWIKLFIMGLCAYTIGNGTLFWGLQYVPATTGSFLISLTPLPILFLGIFRLREIPTRWQLLGLLLTLGGCAIFFSPGLGAGDPIGVGIIASGLLGFAIFAILAREIARERQVNTLTLTAIPLGFGGAALLLAAPLEGPPRISPAGWGIILWLALINTVIAYMLYHHSLRVLTALELNVLLNLSPLGTALLAAILLNERLTSLQFVGIIIAIIGVVVVQWRNRTAKVT
jgi:drug/metabolite transporter (DMT)-like permease